MREWSSLALGATYPQQFKAALLRPAGTGTVAGLMVCVVHFIAIIDFKYDTTDDCGILGLIYALLMFFTAILKLSFTLAANK